MPDPLPPKLSELLEFFDSVSEPGGRATLLLENAEQYREVPPAIATRPFPDDHRVQYCESGAYVWVVRQQDGTLKLYFAVENPSGVSAKALARILDRTLSDLRPEQIAGVPDDIVLRIFRQNLSMGKGMGLMSIVRAVKAFARQYVKDPVTPVD